LGDTPTKQYRVTKDNTEARQDEEIRKLRDDFAAYRSDDIRIHRELTELVTGVAGTLGKYTFAGKLVWGLVGIFLASLAGLFGWQTARIGSLHTKFDDINARVSRIEAHTQDTNSDVDDLRQQIRELRKRLARGSGREE